MGRRHAAALTAAALALAGPGCGFFGDSVEGSLEPLTKKVRQSARTGEPFRLSDATDFEWQRVYVIHPYSSPEDINEELGFDWGDADESSIESLDWIHLLVFVADGHVVRAFDHDVEGGYFSCLSAPVVRGGLSRRDALLKAVRVSGGSPGEVALVRARDEQEAARLERCARTYYD